MVKKFTKHAFTLAEVLIVIGVIGVVAAITIPTLIPLIKDKVDKNRKEVIEDRLIQGMNQLNTLDDGFSAGYENTKQFVEALSKYYKMSAICGADDLQNCIPYSEFTVLDSKGELKKVPIANLKTPEDFGLKATEYLEPASFINSQGIPFFVAMKKGCIHDTGLAIRNLSDMDCVAIMYDKNGANLPNRFGVNLDEDGNVTGNTHDLISYNGMKLTNYFAVLNGVKLLEPVFFPKKIGEYTDENGNALTCSQFIDSDIFGEFKVQGCPYGDDDYWVGAKYYCKTQGGHLATLAELTKIVMALYRDDNGNYPTSLGDEEALSGYNLDIEKANKIGMNVNTTGSIYFFVFSGQTYKIGAGFASARCFYQDQNKVHYCSGNSTTNRQIRSICVSD